MKTVTLKSNNFFDGPEDYLESVSTFFSTFLFELGLMSNFNLIPIKTSNLWYDILFFVVELPPRPLFVSLSGGLELNHSAVSL